MILLIVYEYYEIFGIHFYNMNSFNITNKYKSWIMYKDRIIL